VRRQNFVGLARMELIDTHAHLTFPELQDQVDAIVARSVEASVTGWITIGTDVEQIQKALSVAQRFDNMYAAIGFHPHYANDVTAELLAKLTEYAKNNKVVAIGETGLDYHYDNAVPEKQQAVFTEQLKLAEKLNLPVIAHTRDAFEDTMSILNEFADRLKNVVVHCFSGGREQAQLILDKGFHISFTGIVTFKRSDDLRETAKMVPLERMMVETDCPFISPEPIRNQRPCEPAFVVHTAKTLAQLHNLPLDDFAQKVTQTSRKFFNI
jgi:TatD DNase family protein